MKRYSAKSHAFLIHALTQGAQQAGVNIPQWPILFYKPWTALNTPSDPIPVTAGFQTQGNFTSEMDYETELVVIIKKTAFNISDDEALDHVLGYSVGHDVSHRGWQIGMYFMIIQHIFIQITDATSCCRQRRTTSTSIFYGQRRRRLGTVGPSYCVHQYHQRPSRPKSMDESQWGHDAKRHHSQHDIWCKTSGLVLLYGDYFIPRRRYLYWNVSFLILRYHYPPKQTKTKQFG